MSTTPLYIDLSKIRTFIADDATDSSINGSFEQKQDNLPKLIWAENVSTFSGGIKSVTATLPSNMTTSPDLGTLGQTALPTASKLSVLLDENGISVPSFRESYPDVLFANTTISTWGTPVSSQWNDLVTFNTSPPTFIKRHTTFQTQTVGVFEFFDSVGPAVTKIGDVAGVAQVYTYNSLTGELRLIRLIGISFLSDKHLGITSFQNYLLFWTKDTLKWSSPTDFTDFTPLIGGGGSTKISEAKGSILYITPNPQGLVIYCEQNIVHAAFSGDSANPWVFNEISGSSGLLMFGDRNALVTDNEISAIQVAMTSKGLVFVNSNQVQPLPAKLNEMVNNLTHEYRLPNSVEFKRTDVKGNNNLTDATKVRNLQIVGDNLFIYLDCAQMYENSVLELNGNYSRTIIYNLVTGDFTSISGIMLSAMHSITSENKLLPDNYLMVMRENNDSHLTSPVQVNLSQGTDRLRTPVNSLLDYGEFIVGVVSVSRGRTTIIHSIRLDGRITDDEDLDFSRIPTVLAYSKSTLGANSPVEFIFNPATGEYYGYIEGKDLLVEVKGTNFYLTGMSIEVERGGEF